MTNLIYVNADITCNVTKKNELYVTSIIKLQACNKTTSKSQEVILKPKKYNDLKLSDWQLLCAIHNKSFNDSDTTLRLTNVQAYLIKGYTYKPYYLIRIRLHERISLSIFLDDNEINLLTNYLNINAEFKDKGKYEIMPFQNPIKA